MISREREKERKCEHHRKEHPCLALRVGSFLLYSRLGPPGGLEDPTPGPRCPPWPSTPSNTSASPCGGPLPTPCLVTSAHSCHPPCPADDRRSQHPLRPGRGRWRRGPGALRTQLLGGQCPFRDEPEAAAAAPREPGEHFLWDFTAALHASGQIVGLATNPPPVPAPCSPMVGPRSPRRSTTEDRPYHRSRDGQDTHVDGHGRTEGALRAVQSRWSRTPTLDGGDPFWETSSLSWASSPRQPLTMWGALLASLHEALRPPQDKSPKRGGHASHGTEEETGSSLTDTDLRLQDRPRGGCERRCC